MKVNQIFELKFTYNGEREDGELAKKKLKVLTQCFNYTEAEQLVQTIIDKYNLESSMNVVTLSVSQTTVFRMCLLMMFFKRQTNLL